MASEGRRALVGNCVRVAKPLPVISEGRNALTDHSKKK